MRFGRSGREHRRTAGDRDDSEARATDIASPTIADALAGAGESAGLMVDPELPERFDSMPILAFKGYDLAWARGGKFFLTGYSGLVREDEDAQCAQGFSYDPGRMPSSHENGSPELQCSCGFYGVRDPLHVNASSALVDVELSGRVISHHHGYRAEHQRILRIDLGACWVCGAPPARMRLTSLGESTPAPHACCVEHIDVGGVWPTVSLDRVLMQLEKRYPHVRIEFAA